MVQTVFLGEGERERERERETHTHTHTHRDNPDPVKTIITSVMALNHNITSLLFFVCLFVLGGGGGGGDLLLTSCLSWMTPITFRSKPSQVGVLDTQRWPALFCV